MHYLHALVVRSWKCVASVPGAHRRSIRTLAWSPDGRMLASASFDATIGIWKLSKGFLCSPYSFALFTSLILCTPFSHSLCSRTALLHTTVTTVCGGSSIHISIFLAFFLFIHLHCIDMSVRASGSYLSKQMLALVNDTVHHRRPCATHDVGGPRK